MSQQPAHDSTTLRDYLHVVRRRKWVIAQAIVLVPLAAVLFSLHQQKRYQGSADVLLSNQNLALQLNGTQDPNVYQQADRTAQTQADLARVPIIAQRTLKAVGLTDRTPEQLLANSTVTPAQNANLLAISVTDPNPSLARRLTSEYARQFSNYRRELDAAPYVNAVRDVDRRIKALEQKGQGNSVLHSKLVSSAQELRTREALQTSNAYPVKLAGAAVQVQPKPVRNGILGLALGLVLGIGLAFLWEALDTRVRSGEEISDQLGLPLLGRLPEPAKALRTQDKLVMLEQPYSPQSEAFRVLRTNLEFVNLDRQARTIMFTSGVEGEGKSTSVANLAIALARAGKRVALVDLDLRRPFIGRFFGLNGRPGLTDVALGHAELDDALATIAVTATPGMAATSNGKANGNGNGHAAIEGVLEVLTAGPVPPDAGEFVASARVAAIIERLADRFDVVLIDAAPLLHIGDTITLSARVDALIVVTRLNVLKRPMVKEIHRVLESCPAQKLGFVLTGSNLEEGYGYGGYYSSYHQPAERQKEPVA